MIYIKNNYLFTIFFIVSTSLLSGGQNNHLQRQVDNHALGLYLRNNDNHNRRGDQNNPPQEQVDNRAQARDVFKNNQLNMRLRALEEVMTAQGRRNVRFTQEELGIQTARYIQMAQIPVGRPEFPGILWQLGIHPQNIRDFFFEWDASSYSLDRNPDPNIGLTHHRFAANIANAAIVINFWAKFETPCDLTPDDYLDLARNGFPVIRQILEEYYSPISPMQRLIPNLARQYRLIDPDDNEQSG